METLDVASPEPTVGEPLPVYHPPRLPQPSLSPWEPQEDAQIPLDSWIPESVSPDSLTLEDLPPDLLDFQWSGDVSASQFYEFGETVPEAGYEPPDLGVDWGTLMQGKKDWE